jgi:hypothetical protein
MIGTKGRILIAGLVLGAGAALAFRRPVAPPPPPVSPAHESAHASGMDHAMAAVIAMQHAPEGSTPCESAYNAFKASQDVAQSQNVKAVVLKLAPRDEFLSKCSALPPAAQTCLVPRYLSRHHQECSSVRATADTLAPMVELMTRTSPGFSTVDDNEPAPFTSVPPPVQSPSAP